MPQARATFDGPSTPPPMTTSNLIKLAIGCFASLLIADRGRAQCHFTPAGTTPTDSVSFTLTGSSFQSYGCLPIDPTYWIYGYGITATATFTYPMNYPGIRVWGMNTDDSARVEVDGVPFPLDPSTAYYTPKVLCGLSPGPDGVEFVNGLLVGANTPLDGNYSYQDVFLYATGVTTITIEGVSGAGWGFDGVLLECGSGVWEPASSAGRPFPDPVTDLLFLPGMVDPAVQVQVFDGTGSLSLRTMPRNGAIDLSHLAPGTYLVECRDGGRRRMHRIVKF